MLKLIWRVRGIMAGVVRYRFLWNQQAERSHQSVTETNDKQGDSWDRRKGV